MKMEKETMELPKESAPITQVLFFGSGI